MKKGPGKSTRKGMTIIELMRKFPNDEAAQKWFEKCHWPKGAVCPHCGSSNVQSGIKHRTMTHRCRDCENRKMFSLKTGTVMEGSKLGYQKWAIAIYLLTTNLKGVSSMKLHRDLGVTQKSAWHLAHRLRKSWEKAEADKFDGPVEADEAYFGGRESNKHASDKLHAGRGTVGKTAVVGVKDRLTKQITAKVIHSTDGKTLKGFVRSRINSKAKIYTDESLAYEGLNREAVRHSTGEYVNGQVHTNGIESFWAMLKRGFYGTYHHMSPKHLDRYVIEFSGRHNNRSNDTVQQMEAIAHGINGKKLTYKELIS